MTRYLIVEYETPVEVDNYNNCRLEGRIWDTTISVWLQ